MSRFHSYINSAVKLVGSYEKGKPLSLHVRSFFAADKKFGSKDRRNIASLCYYYFRTGNAFSDQPASEKMLNGLFLCEQKHNELLAFFHPELDDRIGLPVIDKMAILGIREKDVFPLMDELADGIDKHGFVHAFFKQLPLYLRIRPGKKAVVLDKLKRASADYELIGDDCIRLEQNFAADKILKLDKEAVVQDLNSQKVLDHIGDLISGMAGTNKVTVWDCCAASGGKSILLFDKLKGNVKLTVSDIRKNILVNLENRFQQAGINLNHSFTTDLTVASGLPENELFDLVICDAPCTGSGTWSRTPEQLFNADAHTIEAFSERQVKIISNTVPHVQTGGLYVYITCSVFYKENEQAVSFIRGLKPDWQLLEMEYLKGYEMLSDSMFVAVFRAFGV